MRRTSQVLITGAFALATLVACGGDDDTADSSPPTPAPTTPGTSAPASDGPDTPDTTAATPDTIAPTSPPTTQASGLEGDVTVFAAASLTDAFTEAEAAFEAANPGVDVLTNFAASSELATQIIEGAPADVFASADLNNINKVVDEGLLAGEPSLFATNLLEIIVEEGNPLGITGVADLADPDLILAICAPEVPCGGYAATIFENAGVTPEPDSLEENVRAVVTKITAGEADAGIAYTTDILAVDDQADGVPIPADQNVIAEYPIGVTAEAPNPEAGQAFVDFILSDEGQAILASYGFAPPPGAGPAADIEGVLNVFAATSLTKAFTDVEAAFEALYPDVDVVTNFHGSSDLVTQILEGAPVDVFASADQPNMAKVTDAGAAAGDPVLFATNLLEIIVGPGNPEGITGIEDLADDDLVLVVCAPEVPCGNYANQIFENASVTVEPDSLEENVGAVVTKVTAGEADAGIVYATDVTGAGDAAEGVEIPADINVIAQYPIVTTAEAANPEAATAFIDFLTGPEGLAILAGYGFSAP